MVCKGMAVDGLTPRWCLIFILFYGYVILNTCTILHNCVWMMWALQISLASNPLKRTLAMWGDIANLLRQAKKGWLSTAMPFVTTLQAHILYSYVRPFPIKNGFQRSNQFKNMCILSRTLPTNSNTYYFQSTIYFQNYSMNVHMFSNFPTIFIQFFYSITSWELDHRIMFMFCIVVAHIVPQPSLCLSFFFL